MAGDPPLWDKDPQPAPVSIRARHRWRAIPSSSNSMMHPSLFQSAPAIDGGRSVAALGHRRHVAVSIRARHRWRAIRPDGRGPVYIIDVSIRARHRWRAIRAAQEHQRQMNQFQSAPAIDGGRSRRQRNGVAEAVGFQSAPAIDGGRSGLPARKPRQGAAVSIRARHRWRAIQ